MTVPAAVNVVVSAVFAMVMPGLSVAGMVTVDVCVTSGAVGGVPVAVPVFVTDPLSTSACVVVYVAVHVPVSVGASEVNGHEIAESPGNGSVTVTGSSVT